MKTDVLKVLYPNVVKEHYEYVSNYPYSAAKWAETEGRTLEELLLRTLRNEHSKTYYASKDILTKFRWEREGLKRGIFLRKVIHKVCTEPCDLRKVSYVNGDYYPQLNRILTWAASLPVKEQAKLLAKSAKEIYVYIPVGTYKTPYIMPT